MKKLWTALLSAILCCSLAFGAVSVCAETGGDTNVVPVLTTDITQADWDSAEKYEMTAVSEGTSGATGTVSFLATGTRLYFLMQVQDATKFDSDRPDYTITIGGKTASARGKFWDSPSGAPWMADRNTDFGQPIKMSSVYTDGVYNLEVGV